MSQTLWEINGLSLELDMEDYETNKRYIKAFEEMAKKEKEMQKDGDLSEKIKNYCLLFYDLYDAIFGKGVGEKIFKSKYNSRICDEIYEDFLKFIQSQQEAITQRKEQIFNYDPKRRTQIKAVK